MKRQRFLAFALLLSLVITSSPRVAHTSAASQPASTLSVEGPDLSQVEGDSTPAERSTDAFVGRVSANLQVTSLAPLPNTHTAALTTSVSITYGEAISLTTVTKRTFAVYATQTGLLAQGHAVNGGTISLTPVQPFKPGELVQVSATTGTLTLSGQGPISPTVWQFWAAPVGGSGVFTDSGQTLGSSDTKVVALGDLGGDGDLDAFVANRGNDGQANANRVWLNDGSGNFIDSGQSLGTSFSRGMALGDVDGDGDLDVFVGNESSANKVWLNDGTGYFIDSGQSLGSAYTYSVHLGDVDGDGDLDAFVGNWTQADKVWLNDGTGRFIDSGQSFASTSSIDVALGDVDGDGDLDAFVATWTRADKIWLNDGTGHFIDSGHSLNSPDSYAVALGDVNGDGSLDAFTANGTIHDGRANKVWLNDGTGYFIDSGQSLGSSSSFAVHLGDVDGDGDLDAFVGNYSGYANKVWLNDGTGYFIDSGQSLGGSDSTDVALGDVDGDGDLDAFVGNFRQADRVWLNQNPPSLTIGKTGPIAAMVGDLITYTLTVTNDGQLPATNLAITDSIPAGANYVSGGTRVNNVVSWTAASLAVSSSTSVQFAVTAPVAGTIVNSDYHVVADTGYSAVGSMAVATIITDVPIAGLAATNDSPTPSGHVTTLAASTTAGSNVNYTWDLGDGNTDIGPAVTHAYPNLGVYTAIVTASNSVGIAIATTTVNIAHFVYLPLVMKRWPPIPYTPVLNPIDNTDQDSYYAVTWQEADLATTYILEEATNASFSGAQVVYQGVSLSWTVPDPGKTPGTYYYRVKGRNSWGDSSWSNVQSTVVSQAELIINGGFETGPPALPWVQSSNIGEMIHHLGARTGNWGVYMGGAVNAADQIYQEVTIPAAVSSPQLSYWRLIRTSDSTQTAYDEMRCAIWDTTGDVLAFCGQFSNVDQSQDWIHATYDMSAFRGRTVHIGFKAFNDGQYDTQFFIDDVRLSVTSSTTTQANEVKLVPSSNHWRLTGLLQAPQQGEGSRLPSRLKIIPR